MLIDYHVHTEYSDDSDYPMKQVIEDAINMGMKEICFTDHVDYGIKEDWNSKKEPKYYKGIPIRNVNYPEYIKEINELKERYKDRISIKTGLEFVFSTYSYFFFYIFLWGANLNFTDGLLVYYNLRVFFP